MKNADLVGGDGGGVTPGVKTVARSLAAQQLNARVVDKRRERANRVRAATHARHDDVGQAPLGGKQLGACLVTDDTLEVTHELGERVRTRGGAENVVRRLNVGHPVAERLVDGILEGRRTGGHGDHLGPQHLHARDVEGLTLGVLTAHVDRAIQPQECGGRRGGHAVLARTRLSDDARLAQLFGEQSLTQYVVDLVGTRVVEVLTLEEDAHAAQIGRKARSLGQQGGTTGVVGEQVAQAMLEGFVAPQALPRSLNLLKGSHERLGDEAASEIAKVRSWHKVFSRHHNPSLSAAATRALRSVRSAGCCPALTIS